MKTKLLTLIIGFTYAVVAQNNPDRQAQFEKYRLLAEKENAAPAKLILLDSVLKYVDKSDPEAYSTYAFTYIDLAEELKEYEKMANAAVKVFYTVNILQNNNQKALKLIERVKTYELFIKDSFLLGSIYLKRGGAFASNNPKEAIENYSRAIKLFGTKDSIFVADAYFFRAQQKTDLSDFIGSIKDYEIASIYYESLKDFEYATHALTGIAVVYGMNGFLDKAIKEREKCISFLKKNNLPEYIPAQLCNNATDYGKMGNTGLQEKNLIQAFNQLNQLGEKAVPLTKFENLILLQSFYHKQNLPEKHAYYFLLLKEFEPQIAENNFYKAHYLDGESNLFALQNKPGQAIERNLQALELAKKINLKEFEITLKGKLANLYEATGQVNNALMAQKEHTRLKDSVFNQQKTNALLFYQTLYETEKKERELVQKATSIELLEKDNQAKKRLLGFSVAGLSLVFLSIFLYRNRQYLKKTKQQQEAFSQQLLQSQEAERERISKDLHDGVGQSLLLIKNKVVLNADEQVKDMFNNAIEEVRSISRALHPFQLKKFGITKAIENTLNELDESSSIFISSEIDDIAGVLSEERELHLYRIFQESLSNIIKHAETESAKVNLTKTPTSVILKLQDHGKGFDFSEKFNDFESLGLKTLKERTKLLRGTMKVESEKGKGTTLTYIIPIE